MSQAAVGEKPLGARGTREVKSHGTDVPKQALHASLVRVHAVPDGPGDWGKTGSPGKYQEYPNDVASRTLQMHPSGDPSRAIIS